MIGHIRNQAGKVYFERIDHLLSEQCQVKEVILWTKKDQLAVAPPEMLDEARKTCDAVIAGTGVWGSCPLGGMSNAINMERNGLPAVTIVHERFEGPAKANAKFLKLLSARIVVIIEGTGTPTPEEQRKKIDGVWPQILKGLTSAH